MNGSLTATHTLLAGLLMVLSIACDTTPAGSAPTPADPRPVSPIPATPAIPEPTPADPATPDPDRQKDDVGDVEALDEAQAELDTHRALWTTSRSDDYSFVLAPMCFCPQDLLDPVMVRVENGVVTAVTYVESGKAPEHDGYGRYVTIDDLFDTIQEAIDGKASQITATYDPEIGYPTDVRIDYDARMADEEYMFTASGYSSADGQYQGGPRNSSDESATGDGVKMMEVTVGPELLDCVGVGPRKCLEVDGKLFYDGIDGFKYEESYTYRLKIERYDAFPGEKEPPQDASKYGYRLIEVISKTSR